MNLDQVHQILGNADPSRWHRRAEGGPTYRYQLSSFSGADGNGVDVDQHPLWAVYRDDVNLTLAWGLDTEGDSRHELVFDWQRHFIDRRVTSMFADVFWAGALIDRFRIYYIDGGHFLVPRHHAIERDEHGEPTKWEERLTTWEVDFGELVSLLERGSSSRDHVTRAGITVIEGGPGSA